MSGNVFTPSAAGLGTHIISYTYTDNNGCTASDELTIIVEDCTVGIEENLLNDIILYPNPNDGMFRLSNLSSGMEMKIFSVDGKLIFNEVSSDEQEWIQLKVEPGMYTLKLEYNGAERNVRFVIR